MDKVLKLSNKIANAGFEPDMWTNVDDGGNLILDFLKWHEEQRPYFSADWCWKMLPEEIKLKINMSVMINCSLHESLLELVCWCIDNGHLIPSNKGELE